MTDMPGLRYLAANNFNPHEREARDLPQQRAFCTKAILIHTSVKLVTK